MIVRYSKNPFFQAVDIAFHNRWRIILFIIIAEIPYTLYHTLGIGWVKLPVVPVTILGGALAIFLGFRNSSAYDRWWEARKVWGAIVNDSRSFTVFVLSYFKSENAAEKEEIKKLQKVLIYRHIGWLYTLKSHLRKIHNEQEIKEWYSDKDQKYLKGKTNIPAQTLFLQQQDLAAAYDKGWMSDYRYTEMGRLISRMYDWQGKCERIKNTVFPFYYNYYTQLFLWVFTLCLPFALVPLMGWIALPISVAISFVFSILEKSGLVTENPFEGRAADTPMKTLCRSIEIDLREMLGDSNIPGPLPTKKGRFGVLYKE
ncbi:MAG: bestrophin family protein [Luteibaculum sp.]